MRRTECGAPWSQARALHRSSEKDRNVSARYIRKISVESAPLNEEEILFHAETQKFIMLNETGRFFWDQLSPPHST